jgi:hypothetical protein
MNNKRKECYTGIFNKIDCIEDRISEIKEQLVNLKKGFLEGPAENNGATEVDAEKALLEIISETTIGTLLESDSQGDG